MWFNLLFHARNVDRDNTTYMYASVRLDTNNDVHHVHDWRRELQKVASENVYLMSSRPKRAEFVRLVAIVSSTHDRVVVHVERHRAWSVGMFPATLRIGYLIKAQFDEGESMIKHVESRFGRCDGLLQWDYLTNSLCGKDSFSIEAVPIPCRVSIEISSVRCVCLCLHICTTRAMISMPRRYEYEFAWRDVLLATSLSSVIVLAVALPTIIFFVVASNVFFFVEK